MTIDTDIHYDFSTLVRASRLSLLTILAEVHSSLANLHIKIAFLKSEESRDPKQSQFKAQRIEMEGLRDAYSEKKWLVKTLLDERPE